MHFSHSVWSYLTPLVSGCVVWVFAQEQGRVSTLMRTRPIAALGRWSYSLYMLHWVFIVIFFALEPMYKLRGTSAATVYGYGALALSIAMAAFSYRFIERPSRDFFNRMSDRIDAALVQKLTRGWYGGKPAGAPRAGD
jgi:peptidoglycan/LPS O-acetylase OafA/YrhL